MGKYSSDHTCELIFLLFLNIKKSAKSKPKQEANSQSLPHYYIETHNLIGRAIFFFFSPLLAVPFHTVRDSRWTDRQWYRVGVRPVFNK
jgi:hypothetical protein